MIMIKYNILALLALLITFASCSKDMSEDRLPKLQTRTVYASFSIEEDGLRLAQMIDNAGVPKTWMEEGKDLKIRFAIRAKGGTEVAENVLICEKQKGRKAVSYAGEVNIPAVTGVTDFEIAGIVLAVMNGNTEEYSVHSDTFESSAQMLVPDGQGIVTKMIPYVLDWTDIKLVGNFLSDLKLTFKPRGNLLRFTIKNNTGESAQVKGINVWSNAFFTKSQFRFDQPLIGGDLLTSGYVDPENLPKRVVSYDLPEVKTFIPGEAKTYYLWVAPRKDLTDYTTLIRAIGPNNEVYRPFYSETALKEGSTNINLGLNPEQKLTPEEVYVTRNVPLRHLAKYNLKSTTEMTTATTELTESKYFYYGDTQLNTSNVLYTMPVTSLKPDQMIKNINVPGYYLANQQQWTAIMPSYQWYDFNDYEISDRTEQVWFPGETGMHIYQSDYKGVKSERTIYALRFIGEGNRKLVAIRYRAQGSFALNSTDSYLEMKSRYLGPTFTGTLESIANDAYWNTPDPTDVVRRLPALGYMNSNWNRTNNPVIQKGQQGYYWGNSDRPYEPTPADPQARAGGPSAYFVGFRTNVLRNAWNSYPATNAYPVRLFMSNPLPEDQMP